MKPVLKISLLILLTLSSCTVSWQKAMHYGDVQELNLTDTISAERFLGLMIVPVQIEGEAYRFLFDTGAPFAISEELQQRYQYKTVSKGHIVDSDNNRSKIAYVSVDSLRLSGTTFANMTAFVGDFRSNPKLACLELDGIIGSNLMRHCNWSVDLHNNRLLLNPALPDTTNHFHYPFSMNKQYDILVDLSIKGKSLKHIKVDYGSNGYFSVNSSLFQKLLDENLIADGLINRGESQSGIIGDVVCIEERMALLDSLWIGEALFSNLSLEEGSSTLFGTACLEDYMVTIDWKRRLLFFEPQEVPHKLPISYGFTLGIKDDSTVYVQSVVDSLGAFNVGLRFGDEVLSVNYIDFSKDSYCDYVELMNKKPDSLKLKVVSEEDTAEFCINRELLY